MGGEQPGLETERPADRPEQVEEDVEPRREREGRDAALRDGPGQETDPGPREDGEEQRYLMYVRGDVIIDG